MLVGISAGFQQYFIILYILLYTGGLVFLGGRYHYRSLQTTDLLRVGRLLRHANATFVRLPVATG